LPSVIAPTASPAARIARTAGATSANRCAAVAERARTKSAISASSAGAGSSSPCSRATCTGGDAPLGWPRRAWDVARKRRTGTVHI
jgi:hypothetical protein